jgi:flagellar biosynthesis/type III secretory pathway M-ring protein FliF/YscJ
MNRNDAEFSQQSAAYQNMGMKSQLKDAQSNKTISIVTMTFLPATAVAAVCSMGVFDWQQPDKVHVSPHFWIFWVVAIILTAIVLGVFLIWKRGLRKKARLREQDEEDEKAKRDEDDEEDSEIPDEPKYGASRPQQDRKREKKDRRMDDEEKQAQTSQRDLDSDEQIRRSRRKSRHRSHSRRSPTTSRDRRARPDFSRTASGLSFRGQSAIV